MSRAAASGHGTSLEPPGARLRGKVALVAGGTSGIGRAIALRFAAEGAAVVVGSRTRDSNEGPVPTDELIRERGGVAEYVELDVTDPAVVERAVAGTIRSHGDLHILVFSAGTFSGGDSREIPLEDFDRQFAVDVRGAFLCAREVLKHFVARRYGKVVLVSSNFGLVGVAGFAAYCAAKAAVIGLARALAVEFGPSGVNVNALLPGATHTASSDPFREDPAIDEIWRRMTPLRLPGEQFVADADDVANAALFLASDESRAMTGHGLVVDGGWTAL
jgi:NAD(P)-dependent dehydrogenase (short-subunit alcohol dehydrogenase family)